MCVGKCFIVATATARRLVLVKPQIAQQSSAAPIHPHPDLCTCTYTKAYTHTHINVKQIKVHSLGYCNLFAFGAFFVNSMRYSHATRSKLHTPHSVFGYMLALWHATCKQGCHDKRARYSRTHTIHTQLGGGRLRAPQSVWFTLVRSSFLYGFLATIQCHRYTYVGMRVSYNLFQ